MSKEFDATRFMRCAYELELVSHTAVSIACAWEEFKKKDNFKNDRDAFIDYLAELPFCYYISEGVDDRKEMLRDAIDYILEGFGDLDYLQYLA